jgi:AcrR family transcriptional regulator
MTTERREAFLATAKALFEEVGFEQATMGEIAIRAGSSKATLYRYFDAKEALFQELLRRSASEQSSGVFALLDRCVPAPEAEVAEALALLNPSKSVSTTLQEFGEHVLRTFHTPQKLAALRMVIAAATDSEVGRVFYENGPVKAQQYVERYFESVMQAGQLRKADARVAAAQFRALIEAEVEQAGLLNVRPSLSDEEIHTLVSRAVDVFMRAYS